MFFFPGRLQEPGKPRLSFGKDLLPHGQRTHRFGRAVQRIYTVRDASGSAGWHYAYACRSHDSCTGCSSDDAGDSSSTRSDTPT